MAELSEREGISLSLSIEVYSAGSARWLGTAVS